MELEEIKERKKQSLKVLIIGIVFAIIADIARIMTHNIWAEQREYSVEHHPEVDPAGVGLGAMLIGYGIFFITISIAVIFIFTGMAKYLVLRGKQARLEIEEKNK